MRRFFNILLTALSMLAVALLSAFIAMRLAIHGREVEVPNLAGLTLQEASTKAGRLGLSLRLENKFYSADVPSGHILGQFPLPGASVRPEWAIRVTESIGSQQVSIPAITGQAERPASLALRRSSLELGTIASIAAPGDPGIVLAQSPPPNASGVDRPLVSILLSQSASATPQAFVMPQLTGLSVSTAFARAGASGLRITAAEPPSNAPASISASGTTKTQPSTGYHESFFPGAPIAPMLDASSGSGAPASAPTLNSSSPGTVTGQSPPAGHRITRGETIRLTVTN